MQASDDPAEVRRLLRVLPCEYRATNAAKLSELASETAQAGGNLQRAMALWRLAAHALTPISEFHGRTSFAPIVLRCRADACVRFSEVLGYVAALPLLPRSGMRAYRHVTNDAVRACACQMDTLHALHPRFCIAALHGFNFIARFCRAE